MSTGRAPIPPDEAARLDALRSYAILDTPVEAGFEDITRIAAQICGVPIALISLVDASRQWFKAEYGLGERETPVSSSFCSHAILRHELMEIPDAREDVRFAANPLVTGDLGLRFYAGAPLRTSSGLPLGTVCVIDRVPRRLSEGQREALLALSRQTMALLELRRSLLDAEALQKHTLQLMTIAGHDLRQPLQTIALSLELVKRKSTDAAVIRQAEAGLGATAKLTQELDDLAVAASAASNHLSPKKSPVSIGDLFAELESAWRPAAQQKGLRLRVSPCSSTVDSNPGLLKSIIGNLIGNAIKYTERGGVLLGCRRRNGEVRIMVIDTGIGIESGRQDEMFNPFGKANPRSEGLGLGLSIVRNTVELLDHRLATQSIPGRGTVMTISVPLAR